jgi:hypothetical protein
MYQIDSLKRSLEEIAQLRSRMAQIDSKEHYGHSPYAGMFGEATAITRWVFNAADSALKTLATLENLLAGIDAYSLRQSGTLTEMPVRVFTIPKTVTLACPHCGAANKCDVSRDDDIDEDAEACFVAEIDTDRCEDCNAHLCPHCPRFPHPDDKDLIRCGKCHTEASEAEPSTAHIEPSATPSTREGK